MIETRMKMKDLILHLSGLYKVYSKKLEKEIRNGDLPNHLSINFRWKSKMGKKKSKYEKYWTLEREQMQLKIF